MYLKDLKEFVCPKKKYPEDYTKRTVEAIKTITTPKYEFIIFGSSAFKHLVFSADIDIHQNIPVNEIPQVMKEVLKKGYDKRFIIGDIKAGIKSYLLGLMEGMGLFRNGVITGYRPEIINEIKNKYNLKLNIPARNNINVEKWLKLYNDIHNIITLRWLPNDIFKGYLIDGGHKYYLKDVVSDDWYYSLNKIDMYFMRNNRLVELTNIFDPMNKEFLQKVVIYKIKKGYSEYLMPENLNYMKALKRAYSIARMETDANLLNKIIPFLKSPINNASNYLTDINVVLDVLKRNKLNNYIKQLFIIHLKNLIDRMQHFRGFNLDKYISHIHDALNNIDNESIFYNKLSHIRDILKQHLNNLTLDYIKLYEIHLKNLFP